MPCSRISAGNPRFVITVTATWSTRRSSASTATIWSPSFFFQAEDGIRDYKVLEFRRVLFRSRAGTSESLFPASAQANGGIDQTHHGIGLREVAPQFAGREVGVFREEHEGVAQ